MFSGLNLIVSDFLINIAAGWFGAIFVVPIYSDEKREVKLVLLIVNLFLAIVSLVAAFILRNQ